MSETKAVAKTNGKDAALAAFPAGAAIKELINDNMDGVLDVSNLDRIKVPSGGMAAWMVPTLDGEEPVKELEGIIIYKQLQNVYWATPVTSGAGNPPDCVARDAMRGVGDPGGDCMTCPYNQFGSDADGGRGKACKNIMIIYLLEQGKILPTAVFIPPTSVPAIKKHFARITSAGIAYYNVITRLGLEKTKNADGIEYCKVVPTTKTINDGAPTAAQRVCLPPDVAARIAEYRAAIMPALQAVEIRSTDYYEVEGDAPAE